VKGTVVISTVITIIIGVAYGSDAYTLSDAEYVSSLGMWCRVTRMIDDYRLRRRQTGKLRMRASIGG
jgi:hypothetical protein